MSEVIKAIILARGLDTKFLPLSKVMPKELWPLADKPVAQYALEELKASGINKIVFVLGPDRRLVPYYFKRKAKLETGLKKIKAEKALIELDTLKELQKNVSLGFVSLSKELGDGYAILSAKEKIGKKPFVVFFCDDIVESKTPCTLQLLKVFKTCQRPIIALAKTSGQGVTPFGMAEVEKIAHRLFKIKKISKKPLSQGGSEGLALVGKCILTPEVFDYLKHQKPNDKGEIVLADALKSLLRDGKIVYGYEVEGKWLGCEDRLDWLKSHLWLSIKHPQFGEELKKYLRQIT